MKTTQWMGASLLFAAAVVGQSSAQTTAIDTVTAAECPAELVPNMSDRWVQVTREWQEETTWSNDSLRQVLLRLHAADQEGRERVMNGTDEERAAIRAADLARADTVRQIVARYGWPIKSMVGSEGASAAWIIAQHDSALAIEAFEHMKAAPRGEVSPSDLAMLIDRTRTNAGQSQIYGSQLKGKDGLFEFYPIEDLDGLAERRAEAGLMPLPLYVCLMIKYTGPDTRVVMPAGS